MKNKLKKVVFLLTLLITGSVPMLIGGKSTDLKANPEDYGSICRCHELNQNCWPGNRISFRARCNCVAC